MLAVEVFCLCHDMESEPRASDVRLLRAARSLYTNRERQQIIEARIERATDSLMSYLGLWGLTSANLGLFQIELIDGQLQLTKREATGASQLRLLEEPLDPTLSVTASPVDTLATHPQR